MAGNYQRIFVALDGSDAQKRVAERAIEEAALHGATLKFGHVVEPTPPFLVDSVERTLTIYAQDLVPKFIKEAEEAMAPFVEQANDAGVFDADYQILVGDIRETLMEDFIKPFNPDLVVCGDRGLSTIRYVLIGSISKFVIEHAKCDVLVVKNLGD
ncbi:MAG: universal stress protein [Actinobacteria bacterium]|nr:universal stress protein [Actinomycetota bacterium]